MRNGEESLPDVSWFLNCGTSSSGEPLQQIKNIEDGHLQESSIPDTEIVDYGSSKASTSGTTYSSTSTVMMTPPSTPESDDIDFRTSNIKPPLSYAQLITMCMEEANGKKVLLSDIYDFVRNNFAYYQLSDCSWKNSIRHNLSLNKQFVKLPRDEGDKGKGSYWILASQASEEETAKQLKRGTTSCKPPKLLTKRPKVNPAVVSYLDKIMTKSGNTRKRSFQGEPLHDDYVKRQCDSNISYVQPQQQTEEKSRITPVSSLPLPEIVLSFADMDYDMTMDSLEGPMSSTLADQDMSHLHVDLNDFGSDMWTNDDEDAKDGRSFLESPFSFPSTFDILTEMDVETDDADRKHPWADGDMRLSDDLLEIYNNDMFTT